MIIIIILEMHRLKKARKQVHENYSNCQMLAILIDLKLKN